MINWETCHKEFAPDGALRDIYILGTNVEHWKKLFEILKSFSDLEYCLDGDIQPIPSSVDEIFAIRATASPLIRFRRADVNVICHFFCIEQIEFDVDPREVSSATAFDGLTSLLKLLGDELDKRVIMSYESEEQHPFLIYEPSKKEFDYFPCPITP
ncbi:MAG: hypothetical protein ACREDS_08215 [Limisphaerales bacterium]